MLTLTYSWVFWLLPLPLLLALILPRSSKKPEPALYIPFYQQLQAIAATPTRHITRQWRYWPLALLTWLCLLGAASDPQWIGEPIELPQTGRNIMLAVDISGSMDAPDMVVNGRYATRIDVVKHVAADFIEQRKGDRLGLIVFGSRAYLQSPLSTDRKTVRTLLEDASVGMAGEQTAIGDAIGLAIKRLQEFSTDSRILILLTDGINNAGKVLPLSAAKMAAKNQIRIYTIGLSGSDLDENNLRQIAEVTGGRYFRARNTQELQNIYQLLDKLEPIAGDGIVLRPQRALFYWPLTVALLLSLLVIGTSARRGVI